MNDSQFDPGLLLCHDLFQKILALESSVNPFEVYGIASDENAHSRILGRLLSAEGPLGFGPILMPRLIAALHHTTTGKTLDASLVVKLSAAHFKATPEYPCSLTGGDGKESLGRMDLFLEDAGQKLAVVIENKIWAAEQLNQIERYQTWLMHERPANDGWRSLVIYLTPSGESPNTEGKGNGDLPPCARLSYHDLALALEGIEAKDETGVIRSLHQNIKRHIMGEKEEKKLVREIMENPQLAMTLLKIQANMPKLGDIRKEIEEGVRKIVGKEIEMEFYPSRGDLREIKIRVKSWSEAGAPICFVFYHGQLPAVRTMLHIRDWQKSKDIMLGLHRKYPQAIHKDCPRRKDWTDWHLVLATDSDTDKAWEDTVVKDQSFTHKTAAALLERFKTQYETIKPAMDALLEDPEGIAT